MFKIKKLKINLGQINLFWSPKRKRKGLIPQLPLPTANDKKCYQLKLWTPKIQLLIRILRLNLIQSDYEE
jgi:hypothetical protein